MKPKIVTVFLCLIAIRQAAFAQPPDSTMANIIFQHTVTLGMQRPVMKADISDTKKLNWKFLTYEAPFFCRQEMKLEKIITIPVIIRAGSVEDCNYLEQKPGYQNAKPR